MVSIYDCIYKNHFQYEDQKVHVLLPFLKVHFDDNLPLFCEIINSLGKTPSTDNIAYKNEYEKDLFAKIFNTDSTF